MTKNKCPIETKDLALNTKNRDRAIKQVHVQYGPLSIEQPEGFWSEIAKHWNTTERAAKKSKCSNCVAFDLSQRMMECMPGDVSDEEGKLGYCHMHKFKCHSERTCRTWAKGGPITDNRVSYGWQKK